MAERNPDGTFIKGAGSANPGGRTKKRKEIEHLAQQALERDGKNLALLQLATIMVEADEPRDRMKACEILLAYAYGKPTQRKEISGPDGGPIDFDAQTVKQLEELALDYIEGRR